MNILGLNFSLDAAAAIVVDGNVIGAVATGPYLLLKNRKS